MISRVEQPAYKVELEIFEGPLDLLLHLIRRDEVDILDISLQRITDQYLAYLDTFQLLNIDLASEFISMAANLMYLKSRTLLPRQQQPPEEDAPEDDPRWDLIRQLLEYKKFKDAAGQLAHQALEQENLFAHQVTADQQSPPTPPPLAEASIFDLIRAFQKVLQRFEDERDLGQIMDDRHTVSDKMDFLLERVAPRQPLPLSQLLAAATSKIEVIVTFLALLELMKLNQFCAQQDQLWGEITITRKDGL